ncbi:MAG TPA: hypothetical protein VLJ11_20845 [Bryobacteraceae bacterium]|nr:hypothetical protein [Bryobacteraceae bacterium]
MNIVGAFIESLAGRQRDFLATFHLHDNGAFQYIQKRMRIVGIGSNAPGG